MLVVACISYLVDTLAVFLVPDFGQTTHIFVSILVTIAELWMLGYLLVIGVKTVKPEKRFPVVA
jgi:hypothetical protein